MILLEEKEQMLYQRSIIWEEYFEEKNVNAALTASMNIYRGLPRKRRILRKLIARRYGRA